jgi:hypothetical protein
MKIKVELEVDVSEDWGFDFNNQTEKDAFVDEILIGDGSIELYSNVDKRTLGIVSTVHKIEFEVKD